MNKNQHLIDDLETAIIEGSLRTGQRLPAERYLAEKYHLSRSGVREVLQGLKAKGWITSKPGGGHYVSAHLQQGIAEPLIAILSSNKNAHFDLLEFRYSIEGDCAYNAALRANELDIKALTQAFKRLQQAYQKHDVIAEAKADAEFHLAIAEASHNLIFLHLVKSLFSVLEQSVRTNILQMFENDITREELLSQHSAIYDAIINRQPSTAKQAAHQHIHYVERLLYDLKREQDRKARSQRRYHDSDTGHSE